MESFRIRPLESCGVIFGCPKLILGPSFLFSINELTVLPVDVTEIFLRWTAGPSQLSGVSDTSDGVFETVDSFLDRVHTFLTAETILDGVITSRPRSIKAPTAMTEQVMQIPASNNPTSTVAMRANNVPEYSWNRKTSLIYFHCVMIMIT